MAIDIDSTPLEKAIDASTDGRTKIAFLADSNPDVLKKILQNKGETLALSSIEKIADYLGFRVQVKFVKKAAEPASV
jgi:hypothetical protein